ncbi:MAG: transposase [Nannocystis sp.]|nr:transposase [Nannocystis sp.]MBK9752034.1 transposase [Nannocystis sp.]
MVLSGHHPRTHASIRKSLDDIRWVLHHRAAWNQVPKEYGASTTCWRWHQRWQEDGAWIHIDPLITPPSAR